MNTLHTTDKNLVYHIGLDIAKDNKEVLQELKSLLDYKYRDTDSVYLYYSLEDINKCNYIKEFVTDLCLNGYNVHYGGRLGYNKAKGMDCVDNYFKVLFSHRNYRHILLGLTADVDAYTTTLKCLFKFTITRVKLSGETGTYLRDIIPYEEMECIRTSIKGKNKIVLYDTENINEIQFAGKKSSIVKSLRDSNALHILCGTTRIYSSSNISSKRYKKVINIKICRDKLYSDLKITTGLRYVNLDLGISNLNEVSDKFIGLIGFYAKSMGKDVVIISRDKYFNSLDSIYGIDVIEPYSKYLTYMLLTGYNSSLDECKSNTSIYKERVKYAKGLLGKVGSISYLSCWNLDIDSILNTFSELREYAL